MCKKLIIVLALSFCLISSASATVIWDFENGKSHRFDLWSVQAAGSTIDDPEIAGDESLTGAGGAAGIGLPDAGMAWSIGSPDQYDGLKPAVVEGCHVNADGVLEYGNCNDPFGAAVGDPPYDFTNSRGQSGYLNTYALNQWGDNLHTAANDQIATSPPVTLGENAVLTVWAYGGGSGTHAPTYDPDPALMYTDGSCGIAVLLAEDYSILASVKIGGQGTLQEDTLDLSAFAGQTVLIEVVDAFDGSWGWLAIDEIQISNTTLPPVAGFILQLTEDALAWGFDQAQYDHLVTLGYDVDVISHLDLADEIFTISDANEYDVLVISESPNSNGCDSIIGTSAPMMHQEAFGWDNHFFMGVRTNIRWLDGQTQVEIVNDTHPITVDAGFSVGKLPWFTAPEKYTTEDIVMMAPGAELLVKADAEDAAVVFAIEKGAELANGNPAAGRVVCFSISGAQDGPNQVGGILDASIIAPEQWELYDASLRWLAAAE